MLRPSTFSIAACDLKRRTWGVAVASKFPAVGAVVPWARAEAGAVATQSFANTSFGPRGLNLMEKGLSAEKTMARLLAKDPEKETRQVGLVDLEGRAATFTGSSCFEWAGGLTGPGYAVQGNLLTGPEVVQAMEKAFRETKGQLPERLFAALQAGSLAGGDRRGRQSAALYVAKAKGGYGGHLDRWIDYRVDDHIDPIPRLGELLELHHLYFGKSPASQRVKLQGEVILQLQKIMNGLGYYCPVNSRYDDTTREAFRAFIGNENFEERADPDKGWIDRPILDYLLKKFQK